MNIALIFAGGIGSRLNSSKDALPKQFLEIEGKPILVYTLENFQKNKNIDKIYISTLSSYIDYVWELCGKYNIDKVSSVVSGGECAMESIYKGLIAAKEDNCPDDSIVLIHDGVRPIITQKVIDDNIDCAIKNSNAITVIPCQETIVVSEDYKSAKYVPIRKETFRAQAPQTFRLGDVIEAHKNVSNYENIVDNCTLFMKQNKKVHLTEGNFGNIKVTTYEDVCLLRGILQYLKAGKNEF